MRMISVFTTALATRALLVTEQIVKMSMNVRITLVLRTQNARIHPVVITAHVTEATSVMENYVYWRPLVPTSKPTSLAHVIEAIQEMEPLAPILTSVKSTLITVV